MISGEKIKMAKIVNIIIACLGMSLLFGSCVLEYPPEMEDANGEVIESNKVVLHLNISPLVASDSKNPTEMVKSLRVVIIGKGETQTDPDTVECNRLIDIPEAPAANYTYSYMWRSNPGNKDIFVIANESSVSSDLTNLLNGYVENEKATDFLDKLNEYSFNPTYTVDKNNNIYLPYTFSQEGIEPEAGKEYIVNAWLVPVATKFIFNFTNNRSDGIIVNGISMKYANKENYLLAHLGNGELEKEINGQPLSWIDWLAEISKNSWAHPDFNGNLGYNGEVGWIVDYKLPVPDDFDVYTFVKDYDPDEIFTVPAAKKEEVEGVETVTPGKYSTQVYYLPESGNIESQGENNPGQSDTSDENQNSQEPLEHRFYLTMLFQDTAVTPSTPPEFKDVAVPNLKSLFRNTYVVVNVTMSEGEIDVYAEIAPWNEKTANGWVSEGNPPATNPFSLRKK